MGSLESPVDLNMQIFLLLFYSLVSLIQKEIWTEKKQVSFLQRSDLFVWLTYLWFMQNIKCLSDSGPALKVVKESDLKKSNFMKWNSPESIVGKKIEFESHFKAKKSVLLLHSFRCDPKHALSHFLSCKHVPNSPGLKPASSCLCCSLAVYDLPSASSSLNLASAALNGFP